MISRLVKNSVLDALSYQAAVAIIGPRQVGKTTLACEIGEEVNAIYLDLEDRAESQKLENPRLFLERYENRLVILDEVHRMPGLFRELRGIIDRGRRRGRRTGRFLILGSSSVDLLNQSGESLAGRIAYVEMNPVNILERPPGPDKLTELWVRGGYPDSLLARSDVVSGKIRRHFIRTYLERDVAALGRDLPPARLERLWTMLAHSQGGILNASRLARGLGVSTQTVTRYVDLLVGLLLVRRLPPLHVNVRKRLVKSPKVYVRDSGLVHALLSIGDFEALSGHPVVGYSWEGFVIENLIATAPDRSFASFYRTAAGAEADLVLDLPSGERWVIEIKRGRHAALSKGFHNARKDLKPTRSFLVRPGAGRYSKAADLEVTGLRELALELAGIED